MARRGMTRCRWLDLRIVVMAIDSGSPSGMSVEHIQDHTPGWTLTKIRGNIQELEILGYVVSDDGKWVRTSKRFHREPPRGFGVPAKPKTFGPAGRR